MRTSALNQSMRDMNSSPREALSHPLKTPAYTWDSRVSIIRKELVALTGDSDIAVVLNQLLYWSQRLKDYHLLLEEEKSTRYQENLSEEEGQAEEEFGYRVLAQYGWFYKSTSDLIEETLLCVSRVTMRRYLNVLLERGWVQEKGNSQYKWDRTTHYRVNLYQLDKDLKAIGYGLPGFILEENTIEIDENRQKSSMLKNEPSMVQNFTLECKENHSSLSLTDENPQKCSMSKIEPSMVQNCTLECKENRSSLSLTDENRQKSSVSKNEPSMVQNCTLECKESEHSNVKKWSFITENKTEIKNKEHTQRTGAREADQKNVDLKKSEKQQDLESLTTLGVSETSEVSECAVSASISQPLEPALEPMAATWNAHVGQEVRLTAERKNRLQSVLKAYFQNDLSQWTQFCKRVGSSPFLMGQGARKWRVSLDWVLCEENLLKVLEGNFDDPGSLDQKAGEISEDARKNDINAVLASIEDSTWRQWCSQLDFSPESREFVSLMELKSIAHAKFLEVEDDRLVWIGSSDRQTLSRIEDLRFKILPLVQRTFPHIRNLRTRLEETRPLHQSIEENPHTISIKAIQQKGENYAE